MHGGAERWDGSAAEAEAVIAALGLQPHPEGGWYRELHRSAVTVRREPESEPRCGLTLIAYLLRQGERSRWHRVRGADEIWLHAAGAPLDLWALPPAGGEAERLGLGSLTANPTGGARGEVAGDRPARVIAAGWWRAARSRGPWSLVHCAVGPGFAFEDFEILAARPPAARPAGAREDLL